MEYLSHLIREYTSFYNILFKVKIIEKYRQKKVVLADEFSLGCQTAEIIDVLSKNSHDKNDFKIC